MSLFNKFISILTLQIAFITIVFLILTGIRVFDNKSFNDILETYKKYALYDTDVLLVYDGE